MVRFLNGISLPDYFVWYLKGYSSIGLDFFNLSSQQRRTDITVFCMQLENQPVKKSKQQYSVIPVSLSVGALVVAWEVHGEECWGVF